ncbi:MAG: thiamine pyrophosphate-binding protein [Glutamicibacter ardleyensis]|uniref:thiamine pyrophosphate-binding protein n=1 Tax=Glutamicibacter ardleyensis TaxID=225894 RepID=UPI003F992D2C
MADELIARLHVWAISRLFGYSGDGINPILGALRRSDSGIGLFQARHEENAAFMAVAHSKYGIGQFAEQGSAGIACEHPASARTQRISANTTTPALATRTIHSHCILPPLNVHSLELSLSRRYCTVGVCAQ